MQNNTIFALHTNDIDEMATAFGGPNLVATQLSPGAFSGNLLKVQLDDIQCWQISWNQKTQLLGNMPPGTVSLWIPLSTNNRSVWKGFECREQQVILNFDGKVDYTYLASGLVACTIISQQRFLQHISSLHNLEDLRVNRLDQEVLNPNIIQLQILRNLLEEIFSLEISNPELLSQPYLSQMIIRNLFSSIADLLLSSSHLPEKTGRSLTRVLKFMQAIEFIQENLHQPLTIQRISSEVGIGQRSLIYNFKEFFGMGPMEYCKSKRLNAVRRSLRTADAKTVKVIDIARRWGFSHMGHFSANYKAMFGELPSETLHKSF